MKKIFLFLLCLGFSLSLFAQKVLPEIKIGTALYSSAFVQGQEYPLVLTIKSIAAPVTLAWSVEGYGDGTFEINEKALKDGTEMFMGQPGLGATKLGDAETYGLISKTAFKTLTDTKAFTYNNIKFKVKTPDSNPMKIGGKEIDAIHVVSDEGKVELWILNNPSLPIILQTVGLGIDVMVNEIK
ncbi:MAG: hypothetical protein V4541_09145 [Bacteroidota bacterium]